MEKEHQNGGEWWRMRERDYLTTLPGLFACLPKGRLGLEREGERVLNGASRMLPSQFGCVCVLQQMSKTI